MTKLSYFIFTAVLMGLMGGIAAILWGFTVDESTLPYGFFSAITSAVIAFFWAHVYREYEKQLRIHRNTTGLWEMRIKNGIELWRKRASKSGLSDDEAKSLAQYVIRELNAGPERPS